jgi:hypothetical protein
MGLLMIDLGKEVVSVLATTGIVLAIEGTLKIQKIEQIS